jgi:methyltransferase
MVFGWADVLIALVALQRLSELIYARHNTRALMTRGGRETGAGHYPLFALLHGSWLVALFASTEPSPVPQWPWLVLFGLCQGLRVWVLATLGRYWTTRIITVADAPPVATGPYRYIRHPNYLIVAVEIPALPLGLGLPWVAAVFGVLNVCLLAYRINVENTARAEVNSSAAQQPGNLPIS